MTELSFKNEELMPYVEYFESQEELDKYEQLSEAANRKQKYLNKNPDKKILEDVTDKQQEGVTYLVPPLNDKRVLFVGKIMDTCLKVGDGGEKDLESILSGSSVTERIMLILDENKDMVAYCRYHYLKYADKSKNRICVISVKEKKGVECAWEEWEDRYKAVARGLVDQKYANNERGENPVKFIVTQGLLESFLREAEDSKEMELLEEEVKEAKSKLSRVAVGGRDAKGKV